jgi:hypothetical protein
VVSSPDPVRRWLVHAGALDGPRADRVRLRMRGRIRVGAWLRFEATWEGDGRSFAWRARAGPGRLRPLGVVDRFADGLGSMDVRAGRRVRLVHAADEDTAGSGAGRAAVEGAIWAPPYVADVAWRADGDEIVGAWDVGPERPEVRVGVDERGAVRSASVLRWHGADGYVACGANVRAERSFGTLALPSEVSVGWWFGTPRFAPFFEAEVLEAEPVAERG